MDFPGLAEAARRLAPSAPSVFSPASVPAFKIYHLSLFVAAIAAAIFAVVVGLMAYAVIKYRRRADDDGREPVQIYGSNQIELAWTVIPFLIVIVLFLTSARAIHEIQDRRMPPGALEVTVVGHQFWWELRYPQYGVVTANELHVPVSDPDHPWPTALTLLSADVVHSFWAPQLAGKTDLIPGQVNHTWIEPVRPGVYLGQCAMYCGAQHAHMLLRVIAEPRADFERWIRDQKKPTVRDPLVAAGRGIFETTACINCHSLAGTSADGRFGPNLNHLMSRDTLGAGVLSNTSANLRRWVDDPGAVKPGCLMPAMKLRSRQLSRLVAYLETLR